jgi:hypothetical protein
MPIEGHTWVTGRLRVTYHPEWSAELPFVCYCNGTAGAHFRSLAQAWRHLTGKSLPKHFSEADDSPIRQVEP